MKRFPIKQEDCISTHGGSGYSYGDYWDGYDIICGFCGFRITNPPCHSWNDRPLPFLQAFKNWIKGKPTFIREEVWEPWLLGRRGKSFIEVLGND